MSTNLKEEAKKIIDKLPENSTWEDLMHEIYIRQSIEAGMKDSQEGKLTEVEKVRENFGLDK